MYRIGDVVVVDDRMQRGYRYRIVARTGRDFAPGFEPRFTPKEMLALGVFEGKYCNDCRDELPKSWFARARVSDEPDPALNCFGVKSRQALSVWRQKGWILGPDPRGWFQWYCRYYLGRTWSSYTTACNAAQIRAHCEPGDPRCRPRQRQALLQWSHDPFI
jgi:hypothetical protein